MKRKLTVKFKNRLFRSLSASNIFALMKRFSGKVVVVTGSSAGIGQTAALAFAEEGASVVIHGQNRERLEKTEKLLLGEGISEARILKVIGSMEDPKTPERIVEETIRRFGRIDVLVNNAGASVKPNAKDPEALSNLDYLYNVNLRSVIHLTKLALPHLEKANGNVVNVSSCLGVRQSMSAYYSMSKAALDHWNRAMAQTWGPKGVRFNCVNPGAIKTMIFDKLGMDNSAQKMHERWWKKTSPISRYGESYEVAAALKFLASDEASFVTGISMMVDGGWSIATVGMDEV